MRLDRFIAACTTATRTEVKKLIKQGRVTVDGVKAVSGSGKVDEKSAEVCLDGERLLYREFVYLMLNKPSGYVSATYDARQPVVTELVPEEYAHFDVFPAGRLDVDTEGLLLLTNDGSFAHRITAPKKHIYKTYYARLDKAMEQEDIEIFARGIALEDFTAMPAELIITDSKDEVYIKICEGKFHQVKRMCQSVGKNVVYLERVAMGGLELDKNLERGQIREVCTEELDKIFQ